MCMNSLYASWCICTGSPMSPPSNFDTREMERKFMLNEVQ